jgi:large subunit ribosomal protein L24
MKIKKGDKVLIISGKDKGKTGKVTASIPEDSKIVVEGVNVRKKHVRTRREGQKGQVIQMSMPVPVSNAMLVCAKCDKATRVGYKIFDNGKKARVCKKCGGEI